jgi:hypothetical protein
LRLLAAKAIAILRKTSVATIVEEYWPSDRFIERAATAPAMTSVTGWAAELAHRIVKDAVTALGPASAGAEVMKRCVVLTFDGYGSISVPGFVADATSASWVTEGQPIPVHQLNVGPAILNPYKLASIAVMTREMIESSNIEQLLGDTLTRAIAATLDATLFDSNPGDVSRPKGLRNGIAALTASVSTDPFGGAFEDTATLFNAVASVAGAGPYILVSSPGRAASFGFRFAIKEEQFVVLGTPAVGNDLIVIAPGALAVALSPDPEIEIANAGTLVMVDSSPGAAGTQGPERSMFQIDSMALKIRWPLTWVLRDSRGVAWLTPTWK